MQKFLPLCLSNGACGSECNSEYVDEETERGDNDPASNQYGFAKIKLERIQNAESFF